MFTIALGNIQMLEHKPRIASGLAKGKLKLQIVPNRLTR